MTTSELLPILSEIKLGDKLSINGWNAKYTVCGLSEHYILAHYGQHYTIIEKRPMPDSYAFNGVRGGDIRCGPDWWIFGYSEGYDFTNEDWSRQYMAHLEQGFTGLSEKRQAPIWFLSVVGHTDKIYRKERQ